jgi:FAD/FMN-containing dehydrogenase
LKSSIEQKNLSGIEFLDKHSSRIVGIGDKYHIIAEFEDDRGSIKDETYEWIINLRESTYPLLAQAGYTHIEDPEINIEKFKEFAEFLEQKNIPYFGHAGIGVIHPVFRKQDRDKIIEMMQFVKKLGGNISGEHGIGLSKKYFASEELKEEIKKLKAIYDPWSKLNIGKII